MTAAIGRLRAYLRQRARLSALDSLSSWSRSTALATLAPGFVDLARPRPARVREVQQDCGLRQQNAAAIICPRPGTTTMPNSIGQSSNDHMPSCGAIVAIRFAFVASISVSASCTLYG